MIPVSTSGGDSVVSELANAKKKHCAISIMELTVIVFLSVCVFLLLYVCLGVNGVCASQVGIDFSLVVEYLNVLNPTRPLNNMYTTLTTIYIYVCTILFFYPLCLNL